MGSSLEKLLLKLQSQLQINFGEVVLTYPFPKIVSGLQHPIQNGATVKLILTQDLWKFHLKSSEPIATKLRWNSPT